MSGRTGHKPTSGDVARYLHAEHPDTPPEMWSERFEYFLEHGELPKANYKCPSCGGPLESDATDGVFDCQWCRETVRETGGEA